VAHVVGSSAPPAHEPDRTPRGGTTRGKPARGLTQEWKPAFAIVSVLVLVGIVVAAVLWTSLEFGGGDPVIVDEGRPTDTTVAAATNTAPAAEPVGSAAIATITAYDPEGDGTENDADAVLSGADGSPATSWSTSCYSDRFMGAKRGVGLVVTFDGPTQQAITVDVATAPYQVSFFAAADETIPPTLDEWGPELGSTRFDDEPGTITSPVPDAPARHVLVLLRELGSDGTCSDANPYRGRLGEIAPVG
jgi:serine/threonine-protein kinase